MIAVPSYILFANCCAAVLRWSGLQQPTLFQTRYEGLQLLFLLLFQFYFYFLKVVLLLEDKINVRHYEAVNFGLSAWHMYALAVTRLMALLFISIR